MAKACNIEIAHAETFGPGGSRRVGRLIRRRRLAAGMTQAVLAKALNISYQQVQKYENGTNRPPPERLKKIAELLGVKPDFFSGEPSAAGPGEVDALENFLQQPEALILFNAVSRLANRDMLHKLILANLAFCEQNGLPPVFAGAEPLFASERDRAADSRQATREIRALKVEMARAITRTIKSGHLSQAFAARFLSTDQARISLLSRGRVQGISFERLFRFLLVLGWSVRFEIEDSAPGRLGRIELVERRAGAKQPGSAS